MTLWPLIDRPIFDQLDDHDVVRDDRANDANHKDFHAAEYLAS